LPGSGNVPNLNNPGGIGNNPIGGNGNVIGNIGNAINGGVNNPAPVDPNIKPGTGAVETPVSGSAIDGNRSNQLRWQGQNRVAVGDTFLVQLTMASDQAISSLPIAVGFDNKVLQVVGITEGSFLKQGGVATNFTSRIDPNGQILISGTRTGPIGASTPADVVSITFRTLAPSNGTPIQVLTASPIATGGRAIAVQLPPPHNVTVAQ
jgi:general secretion pathway protein D